MTLIPTTAFFVGDLWKWTESIDQADPDLYKLRYTLRHLTVPSAHLTFESVADSYVHSIVVPSSTTTALVPGVYSYTVQLITIATNDAQTLEQGNVTLKPNPTDLSVDPSDSRSKWEIAIEKLEDALIVSTADGVLEYQIGGRMIKKMTPAERKKALAYCRRQLAKEKGQPFGHLIKYTFLD